MLTDGCASESFSYAPLLLSGLFQSGASKVAASTADLKPVPS